MTKPSLISPYPGGKSGGRYQYNISGRAVSRICDRLHHYDVIVEPFAGSGATIWQHDHGIENAIAADIDPGVQAVWECWGDTSTWQGHLKNPTASEVLDLLENWAFSLNPPPDIVGLPGIEEPQQVFESLKRHHENPAKYSKTEYAAAYLTLKRLVFGGILRCNSQGNLNVALSQDKLAKFLNGWQYEWPDNGIKSLTFEHSWQDAVKALADSNYKNALVVIDAPYWTPGQRMTEAYVHHGDPKSKEVEGLTTDCLEAVLATGKAGRVVAFNYLSPELEDEIDSILGEYYSDHLPDFSSNLGPLRTMNNSQGIDHHEYYSEAVWEIGGRRMFQDYDKAQQINLLDLAA